MNIYHFFGALVTLSMIAGCATPLSSLYCKGYVKGTANPCVPESIYKEKDFELETSSGLKADIHYLGSGGFLIETEVGNVLIDPYFSHKAFLTIPFSRLKVKTTVIDHGLTDHKVALMDTEVVLVTHSHYDHLMDVPYIVKHKMDLRKAKVVTSHSGERLLSTVLPAETILDVEGRPWTQNATGRIDTFNNGHIRVHPILSDHAPHYKKIKLYDGEARPMPNYRSETDKTYAKDWKTGMTFSYLIEFEHPVSGDVLCIYIQTSSAEPPMGFMPDSLLMEKRINVALLAAASFEYVDHYPEKLVQHLNPERVVICHWEDFFNRYGKKEPKVVRFTNLKRFIQRLNRVYPWQDGEIKDRFVLPKPGTSIGLIKR